MAAPDADGLLGAHVVDDRRPRVVLRRSHEPLGGVGEAVGRLGDRRHLTAPEEVERRVVGTEIAGLVDRRGEGVGVGAVDGVVQRFDAGGEVLHRPRPRRLRIRDDLLAGGAVVPRVVEDAVMPREPAGEDRGVVGEGDRRESGHRPPFVGGAHLDQASDVGCRAGGGHRVQHVRVHAVEEEADEVTGPTTGGVEHVVAHDAVLAREVVAMSSRARTRGARRGWARRRPGGPPAARSRRCAPPCRRSRTAPAPAGPPTNRARPGGRPGPPSCARRCAARRGRARRDGRRAARCGRRRRGRSSRRGRGGGRPVRR